MGHVADAMGLVSLRRHAWWTLTVAASVPQGWI
jgi:hypothetical protein